MPLYCPWCRERMPGHHPETCPAGDPAQQLPALEREREAAWQRLREALHAFEAAQRDLDAGQARLRRHRQQQAAAS